jgi:MFS transporter, SHS family, lactate transporter
MLNNKYDYSSERIRVTQIVGNLGAIIGSTVIGFGSQIVGKCASITTPEYCTFVLLL